MSARVHTRPSRAELIRRIDDLSRTIAFHSKCEADHRKRLVHLRKESAAANAMLDALGESEAAS